MRRLLLTMLLLAALPAQAEIIVGTNWNDVATVRLQGCPGTDQQIAGGSVQCSQMWEHPLIKRNNPSCIGCTNDWQAYKAQGDGPSIVEVQPGVKALVLRYPGDTMLQWNHPTKTWPTIWVAVHQSNHFGDWRGVNDATAKFFRTGYWNRQGKPDKWNHRPSGSCESYQQSYLQQQPDGEGDWRLGPRCECVGTSDYWGCQGAGTAAEGDIGSPSSGRGFWDGFPHRVLYRQTINTPPGAENGIGEFYLDGVRRADSSRLKFNQRERQELNGFGFGGNVPHVRVVGESRIYAFCAATSRQEAEDCLDDLLDGQVPVGDDDDDQPDDPNDDPIPDPDPLPSPAELQALLGVTKSFTQNGDTFWKISKRAAGEWPQEIRLNRPDAVCRTMRRQVVAGKLGTSYRKWGRTYTCDIPLLDALQGLAAR